MISKQYENIFWYTLLAFTAIMFFDKLLLVLTFRFEIAGLEPYFTYLVLKLGSGHLFTNPELYPFVVTQYSPLYFYIVSALSNLLEWLGVNEVRAVYLVGRGVNLCCNILTSYLIYYFFKQHIKVKTKLAVTIALVVFNLFINHNIGVRPDSLKILFLTAMFIQLYQIIKSGYTKHFYLFSIFAILALLCKQDALVPVLAALLIIFFHRNFVKSVLFGLSIGLITGVIMLGLFHWNIELLFQNLLGGIAQGANLNWWFQIVKLNYLTFIVQVFFLGIAVFWMLSQKVNKVWIAAILLQYISVIMALFKWGSNFNYFIEFQIIIVVLAIYVASTRYKKLLPVVLICIVGIFFNNFQNKNLTIPNFWAERDAYYMFQEMKQNSNEIQTQILNNDSPVICFSLKYAQFLNKNSIQWAMVNDYPEVFLLKLESLSSELPVQVFNYQYDCSLPELQNTVFMAPSENIEWFIDKLNTVFGRSEKEGNEFELFLIQEKYNYSFYEIVCS